MSDGASRRGTVEIVPEMQCPRRFRAILWPLHDSCDHVEMTAMDGNVLVLAVVDNQDHEACGAVVVTVAELERLVVDGRRLVTVLAEEK